MTNPPHFKGYKPMGLPEENNPVVINYEEYEAIRLSDFELYGQVEAAQIMDVSRPTFTRIYESARRKVAQAFVQGRAIVFEGGKVYFDSNWYTCNSCGCWFNHPEKDQDIENCPLCGSSETEQYTEELNQNSSDYTYICPICGYEKADSSGNQCKKEICPTCNCIMISKDIFQNKLSNKVPKE